MSKKSEFLKVPNELVRCGNILPASEHRVLLFLMSLNPCFPSYKGIADACDIHKDTVRVALRGLVDKGLISYKKGSNLTGKANTYYVAADLEGKIKALKDKKIQHRAKVF